MIIADKVLELFPQLDKRGFCVGNIAPDCNEPNEDRIDFIPPRKVTHWMTGEKKNMGHIQARGYVKRDPEGKGCPGSRVSAKPSGLRMQLFHRNTAA